MGFDVYTPTMGLTAAERTQAGYYGAIKAWITAQEDILQYYTVSCDDTAYGFDLTPIAANLAHFAVKISVSTADVAFSMIYTGSQANTIGRVTHNRYADDVAFFICNSGTDFILTFGDKTKSVANVGCKNIDSGLPVRAVICGGQYQCICTAGTSYSWYTNNLTAGINRNCNGKSDGYYISELMIPNTDFIAANVYTADGGRSLPPVAFKFGGADYYTIASNIIIKMGG